MTDQAPGSGSGQPDDGTPAGGPDPFSRQGSSGSSPIDPATSGPADPPTGPEPTGPDAYGYPPRPGEHGGSPSWEAGPTSAEGSAGWTPPPQPEQPRPGVYGQGGGYGTPSGYDPSGGYPSPQSYPPSSGYDSQQGADYGTPYGQTAGYGVDPYPSGYGAPYGVAPAQHPQAVAALVTGILGVVVCPLAGIPGLILGRKARNEIDADPQRYTGRGMATAGFVLGIIGVVITVVLVLLVVVGLASYNG